MARKINYSEGDCLAVPLRSGGYARGIIARMDGKGGVLGYFFGPMFRSLEKIKDCSDLKADKAILVGRCGDLGLLNGEWKVIDRLSNWNKSEWPMPPFIRVDESESRAWLSYYDENDFSFIKEERVSPELVNAYPYDRDMGYGAVELRLTKRLEL